MDSTENTCPLVPLKELSKSKKLLFTFHIL